jgi:hypothetical protein
MPQPVLFLNKNIVDLSKDSAAAIALPLFASYRHARLKYAHAEAERFSLDSNDSSYRRQISAIVFVMSHIRVISS